MQVFKNLGAQKINEVIQSFYDKAFEDPMIGYLFRNHSKARLVEQQSKFAVAMLGGAKLYDGQGLKQAHQGLGIRGAHFDRRQVLMRETLEELQIPMELQNQWLEAEEKLRPLVVHGAPCQA